MAKNAGESRIPVPRATRPSFFTKSRNTSKLSGIRRPSLILSGCVPFVDATDAPATPNLNFAPCFVSTPNPDGNLVNKAYISPAWNIGESEKQQLGRFNEEPSFFGVEDIGDNCSHYLALNKQNSFEYDESLGILTPDQMTDFTVALGCSRTPSCENLSGSTSRLLLTGTSRPSVEVEPTEEACTERTPSPEELPLDEKPSEPPEIITSVTSITSLEAGYQGDGENSRPASRGADPPPLVAPSNLPAPCRQDPMTDSDFFTESDADAHEEIIRGDRKAQVIDGTLFCAPGGRRCPSFTGEEMDSSGVYSDLDKKFDSNTTEETLEESDRTPDTVETEVSQRSQTFIVPPAITYSNALDISLAGSTAMMDITNSSSESTAINNVTMIRVENNNENQRPKTANKKSESAALKKFKMPKRNVVSKIKSMIESGQKEAKENESRRAPRLTKKNGRWDAVMSKIEAGKNEQRTRPLRKEVNSRVLQNITQPSSPATGSALKKSGDDNNNNKDKRRLCGREDAKSSTRETARSSVRSSMSDLSSAPGKDVRKKSPSATRKSAALTRRQPNNNNNNNLNAKQRPIQKVADRDVKDNNRNAGYLTRRNISVDTRDQAAQTDITHDVYNANLRRTEQVVGALSITIQYLAYELDAFSTPTLRSNCDKMKADWSKARIEAEELRSRQSEIEKRLSVEREDHRRALEQLREDLESHHAKRIAELEAAAEEENARLETRMRESLNVLEKEHKAVLHKLRAAHEAKLSQIESDSQQISIVHNQGAALRAEVESLRSVLELRSQENSSLRSELDSVRREVEEKEALQLRVDTLEARCEDLKAQLERKETFERQISQEKEDLLSSFHQVSKQNKRLAQRNEELQWRLRHKNEVVNVLANQLVTSPRMSRSQGPESLEHSVIADQPSPHAKSMMKFMIEKSASVSWTLEIDENGPVNMDKTVIAPRPVKSDNRVISRQGSFRMDQRRSRDSRVRSESMSTSDSSCTGDQQWWTPQSNSTPVRKRRSWSDPNTTSISSTSSSSIQPNSAVIDNTHPVDAAAMAAAAAAAAAADECTSNGQRPQEAGGEAMISEETSASNSEDEFST
ncbi:uncharacterized protein toc [Prorops nasuta]|uniref:uncharacterized protein toc n=1 Tax=Prorops nasuta TaxID=863751 RepID=UPI0034CFF1E3